MPKIQITSAQTIQQGGFTPPKNETPWLRGDPAFYKTLASFCRVTAVARPSADSDIKIEVWLPASGWNGKFQGQGNGGFAGEINYRLMAIAVGDGYATAGTDTGHAASGTDAKWALGHREKIIDFGYRAIHEMTQVGQAVTQAFYGERPQHSYFASCSNGGRQALMEAQRFPADYDGVMAGAPANFWSHLLASALFGVQATTLDPASYIPANKLPAIAAAVNSACDAKDGVADGILNDPRQCHFDPASLVCQNGDSDKCLTGAQAESLKKLYQGAHDSQGREIYPGLLPGAELGDGGWKAWITGEEPGKSLMFAFGSGYFSNMVYGNPRWDYKKANFDQAVKAADRKTASILNATDANLKRFQARGGKLILYHGWNDPAISPLNSINYYQQVVHTMGQQPADSFLRLYMVPGMQHCFQGPGTDSFGEPGTTVPKDPEHNMQLALEQWVEKGVAPGMIVATRYVDDYAGKGVQKTRPLCPYPQAAKYKGSGDTNEAGSFECVRPIE
ncbi:MAG TPA: tannase/feruloyl esterase family alpha/beta hydrolase [Terriglobales bacterium]|nr:tannase/feruloyl esterase family alpha/beta hydrolase [Terriglobales bacterium]